jgi:hypothetical protein
MYNTDALKERASCIEIATLLGVPKAANGRHIAVWRGGKNGNVQIDEKHWWDFKLEKGGDVFDLVCAFRNTHFVEAAQIIADHYGVKPDRPLRVVAGNSRYDLLLSEGYKEVRRYCYTDADGNPVHYAVRMEHPEKKKEFLQCDARGNWTVKHVQLCLYNLPTIRASKWVCVVEGEKDADTLIAWGVPATTNAGGSKKWEDRYSELLAGKDVVLLPDNDDVGRAHMDIVGRSIAGKARSIRVLCVSRLEKGDVTDWAEKEGGGKARFMELLKTAPKWIAPDDDQVDLAMAKEANRKPFANFVSHEHSVPNQKKPIIDKAARPLNEMVEDAHVRLLRFPRKIGENMMFDHDRDTKGIVYIDSTQKLWAWMHNKMKIPVKWTRGDAMVTKGEFYEGLLMSAKKYESISAVPDWPRRSNVYYYHGELPEPSVGHTAFEGLIDFYKPENPYYRILLKALFCAPMFYKDGVERPMWIIDSHEGAGSGKSTLAESVSKLYSTSPVRVAVPELEQSDRLIKRLMSPEGRNAKVFLLDNVTGNFKSPFLSGLITAPTITGMAPYGRGEEVRMNNMTFIVTANSASVDNDIGIRSFYIYLSKPEYNADWKTNMQAYIEQNRMQIFADIIDLLSNSKPYTSAASTRFPEFEKEILHKCCKNESELKSVQAVISEAREESNNEEEMAMQIEEVLNENISELHPTAKYHQFFIPTKTVWNWLKYGMDGTWKDDSEAIQKVRDLAKNRLLECVLPKPDRYPHHETNGVKPQKGVMWQGGGYDAETSKRFIVTYKDRQNSLVEV